MGPTGCPETSVRNYHYSLRNTQQSAVLSAHVDLSRIFIQYFGR
jgi:hypothetical protein